MPRVGIIRKTIAATHIDPANTSASYSILDAISKGSDSYINPDALITDNYIESEKFSMEHKAVNNLCSLENLPLSVWQSIASFLGWIYGFDPLRMASRNVYEVISKAPDDYWRLCVKAPIPNVAEFLLRKIGTRNSCTELTVKYQPK